MNRRLAQLTVTLLLSAAGTCPAQDAFPTHPIRIVIPYAAGSGNEMDIRQLAPRLSDILAQPMVIEARPGAGGLIAAQSVSASAADGHHMLLGSSSQLVRDELEPAMKINLLTDFSGISNLLSSTSVLVVSASLPAKNIKELISYAKSRADGVNYGSGGIGTAAHLIGAAFSKTAGINAFHIPLRGSVDIVPSLLRGDIVYGVPISSTSLPLIRSGKVRALAVANVKRLKALPDTPTLAEALDDEQLAINVWLGLFVSAKTPAKAVSVLHAAVFKVASDPALKKMIEVNGSELLASASPAEFNAYAKREEARWRRIVAITGAKTN